MCPGRLKERLRLGIRHSGPGPGRGRGPLLAALLPTVPGVLTLDPSRCSRSEYFAGAISSACGEPAAAVLLRW
jgi:hypothetical protein